VTTYVRGIERLWHRDEGCLRRAGPLSTEALERLPGRLGRRPSRGRDGSSAGRPDQGG
jgi:hypothetical protein